MAGTIEQLRVFISYARSDSAPLSEELVAGLELVGFRPPLDHTTSLPPKIGRPGSAL
jgi:hypothetical protein